MKVRRKDVEAVLDEYVRPLLATHSEDLINKELVEHVPGVKKAVLENSVSQDLIDQAMNILKKSRGE